MDEIATYLPQTDASRSVKRKTSTNSIQSSPARLRPVATQRSAHFSPLEERFRPMNLHPYAESAVSDVTEIHAPIPQRHLLHTADSPQWLHPPFSSPEPSIPPTPSTAGFSKTSFLSDQQSQHFLVHGQSRRVAAPVRDGAESSMAKRWIRWMHKNKMKDWVIPTAILSSIYIKWSVGIGSYSGQNTPPMFGDYEAQRHWMELTIQLPITQWYTYDLQYWGLDYPPLTAYVSWLCGWIGSRINPSWFALDNSRGFESEESKVFMRATVLALDTLIYIPALLTFIWSWQGTRSKRTQELALVILLAQPALLLIDFGHFQYNSVMLGFTLLAMNCFVVNRDLLGAFFFVLSLGFKQMALYYAPAIGSYLLAKCLYLGPQEGGRLFIRLALVTVLSFIVLFLPFLPPFAPPSTVLGVVSRIFPFNRGLFEDKVANFWCASNVVFKWKKLAAPQKLIKLSTALTALGFLPGVVGLLHAGWKMSRIRSQEKDAGSVTAAGPIPILPILPHALLTSAMSFFLFSFQVHEKTILLPLMPIMLLLSGSPVDSTAYGWGVLVNNVAVFSMWPLLKKDGLGIQYAAIMMLWNRLIGYNPLHLPKKSLVRLLSIAVYPAILVLHIAELVFDPPARYPDIFPVLNVLVSTPVFMLAWLWSIKCGIEAGWAISGVSFPTPSKPSSMKSLAKPPRDRARSVTPSIITMSHSGPVSPSERFAAGANDARFRTVSLGFDQTRRRPVHKTVNFDPLDRQES